MFVCILLRDIVESRCRLFVEGNVRVVLEREVCSVWIWISRLLQTLSTHIHSFVFWLVAKTEIEVRHGQ
jgi:hypothetical protein